MEIVKRTLYFVFKVVDVVSECEDSGRRARRYLSTAAGERRDESSLPLSLLEGSNGEFSGIAYVEVCI